MLICRPRCAFAQETSCVTGQSKRETSNIESRTHAFVHRWLVISRPPSVTPCVHHEPIPLTTTHTQPLLSFHHFGATAVPLGFPLVSPLPFLSSLQTTSSSCRCSFIKVARSHRVVQPTCRHLRHMPCRHPRATLECQVVVLWHALHSLCIWSCITPNAAECDD